MSGVMSPRPDLGPKPHLGYTQSLIDRVAERRLDSAWLQARMADKGTRTYVIGTEMIVLNKGDGLHDPAFTPDEARALAPNTEQVFLGLLDGAARFGTGIATADA
jgi:NAD+ diphosphatase